MYDSFMKVAYIILDFLDIALWPILIGMFVWYFRKDISSKLKDTSSIKFPGGSVNFEEKAKKMVDENPNKEGLIKQIAVLLGTIAGLQAQLAEMSGLKKSVLAEPDEAE